MIRFVNRESELALLDASWENPDAQLIVLYGRRRIGKTTLLDRFLQSKKGIFYVADDVYYRIQINEFKDYVSNFFNDQFLKNITITDWNDLFQYLTKVIPKDERFYIVLDEFTYLSKNDRSIISKFQRLWDTFLSKTKVFFVICGSDLGMIHDAVLSYTSPLYGRRSRDILLGPIGLGSSLEFTELSFEESLILYMTVGGVPEYLTKASTYTDYYFFIMREFGSKQGYFYREPYFLLSQEFRDYSTYFSILNAIAIGKNKPSEIADFIGIENKKLYPYLENLVKLGFIIKLLPAFDSRSFGHYELTDNMTEFWFNYVFPNREFIERGSTVPSFDFRRFFGRVFEKVVRNEVFTKLYPQYTIGKWWYRDHEIDVVAQSPDSKKIIVGGCKWKEDVDPLPIVNKLTRESEVMLTRKKFDHIEYHLIAKSFRHNDVPDDTVLYDLNDIKDTVSK